jgi:uncharacterized Zn-binding protein involved in type VI secretion
MTEQTEEQNEAQLTMLIDGKEVTIMGHETSEENVIFNCYEIVV